jgi:hypothetical protein
MFSIRINANACASVHKFTNILAFACNDSYYCKFYSFTELFTYRPKVQVKFTLEQATKARGGVVYLTLSLTSALDRSGWSTPRPGRFIPGKDAVPIE